MELKKVEVIWLDAWHDSKQVTQKALDDMKPVPRCNLGYLRKENETEIVLVAGSIKWSEISGEDDMFDDEQVIPKGMIQKIIPQKDV